MDALLSYLGDGGPIVLILVVVSLFSVALIAVKWLQLSGVLRGESARAAAIDDWARGDRTAARARIIADRSPVDRVMLAAMDGLEAGHAPNSLDSDLEWRGNDEMAGLNRHIRTLELIAMVSPLLGLLGTVLGMIQSFQELALAEGAANASLLAGGIWQALLTTAAGLIVAIPAAVAAGLLSSRAEAAGQRMEIMVGRLYAAERSRNRVAAE